MISEDSYSIKKFESFTALSARPASRKAMTRSSCSSAGCADERRDTRRHRSLQPRRLLIRPIFCSAGCWSGAPKPPLLSAPICPSVPSTCRRTVPRRVLQRLQRVQKTPSRRARRCAPQRFGARAAAKRFGAGKRGAVPPYGRRRTRPVSPGQSARLSSPRSQTGLVGNTPIAAKTSTGFSSSTKSAIAELRLLDVPPFKLGSPRPAPRLHLCFSGSAS